MSAFAVEHEPGNGDGWDDDLFRLWEETDWPEGCRVEIIDGAIVVSPAPSKSHNLIAKRLQRQIDKNIPEDWGTYTTLEGTVPVQKEVYIPDLVVMADSVLEAPGKRVSLGDAELVVEITSRGNAKYDRQEKMRGYAKAGVPLYLLIDQWATGGPTITLYGEPKGVVYRTLRAAKFGEEIYLPAPFAFVIDTSGFPVN
jgi:Uma2 family endonuclease